MNITSAEKSRFDSKWRRQNDCHLWTGPLDKDGYGSFYFRRKNRRAHRVAWFMANGPIPEGMVINHTCRNRACVNTQHLALLTVRENALRDSNSIGYVNSQKTVCRNGHRFDKTYTTPAGKTQRVCSTCERDKKRRLRAKWRAEDDVAC